MQSFLLSFVPLCLYLPGWPLRRQPAFASQPYQIQQAPDAQFRAHGRPHAGQSPPGRGQPRQWQADAPHGAQIEQRGHQCAACTLKYAAGHDGRAVHSLGKGLNTQDAGAQGIICGAKAYSSPPVTTMTTIPSSTVTQPRRLAMRRRPAPTLCPTSMAAALWMP